MIYKFKSPATGDLIMLGPQGDQLLQIIGRTPAAKGIIEAAAMAAALAALEAAILATETAAETAAEDDQARSAVGLRQRLWPMVELLRRAQAAKADVVWGV